jgi:integrase
VDGARRPRKPAESTAQGLSRHEVTDWLDAAETRGGSAYACACLLALNGLRVGELCAANIDALGESTWHHTLTLRAETTKGSKAAVIALAPRTVQAIILTRDERRSGALLRNQHGRRMTSYNVAYLLKALCRDIGVARRITPHSLRHSRSHWPSMPESDCATCRTSPATPTPRRLGATTAPATSSTARHLRGRAIPRRRELNRNPSPGDSSPRYHVR